MITQTHSGTSPKRKYIFNRRDSKKSRAMADRELRLSFIRSAEKTIQDVVHNHCIDGDAGTFTTAEIIARTSATDEVIQFILPILRGAEKAGAIRSTGAGQWVVVDEESLYGNNIIGECPR